MLRIASGLFVIVLLTFLHSATALGSVDTSVPTYPVTIEFSTRVKMRDGVELSVDIYRPDSDGRFPVILARTPYNKSTPRGGHLELGRYFAARGYVYVAMD